MDNNIKRFFRKLIRLKVYAVIHFNSGKKYEIYNPDLAIKISERCTLVGAQNPKWMNFIFREEVYLSINFETINYIEYDYELIEKHKEENNLKTT